MGLDMYLYKEEYLSAYSKDKKSQEVRKSVLDRLSIPHKDDAFMNGVTISTTDIYWRKVNSIHAWFVEHVQDGNDDCRRYYVTEHDLKELLDAVSEQLRNREGNILAPQSGFFFGSTEKDDYYWSDLERTKEELIRVLNEISAGHGSGRIISYYYQSSW